MQTADPNRDHTPKLLYDGAVITQACLTVMRRLSWLSSSVNRKIFFGGSVNADTASPAGPLCQHGGKNFQVMDFGVYPDFFSEDGNLLIPVDVDLPGFSAWIPDQYTLHFGSPRYASDGA
jgi:hypothetical protein